jgi:hypothetical protein
LRAGILGGQEVGDPVRKGFYAVLLQQECYLAAMTRGVHRIGDPAAQQQLAWQAIENLRQQQASALAYFDCFWIFAMVTLALVLVVPLMKCSVAEKGAHIAGESRYIV